MSGKKKGSPRSCTIRTSNHVITAVLGPKGRPRVNNSQLLADLKKVYRKSTKYAEKGSPRSCTVRTSNNVNVKYVKVPGPVGRPRISNSQLVADLATICKNSTEYAHRRGHASNIIECKLLGVPRSFSAASLRVYHGEKPGCVISIREDRGEKKDCFLAARVIRNVWLCCECPTSWDRVGRGSGDAEVFVIKDLDSCTDWNDAKPDSVLTQIAEAKTTETSTLLALGAWHAERHRSKLSNAPDQQANHFLNVDNTMFNFEPDPNTWVNRSVTTRVWFIWVWKSSGLTSFDVKEQHFLSSDVLSNCRRRRQLRTSVPAELQVLQTRHAAFMLGRDQVETNLKSCEVHERFPESDDAE